MARKPRQTASPDIEEGPAPIGDNNPPEPIQQAELTMTAEEWVRWMDQQLAPAMLRIEALLEVDERFKKDFDLKPPFDGASPAGIEKWNDDVQARAASLREKFTDVVKHIEHVHGIEKAPVLTASRVIDNAKNRLIQRLVITDSKGRMIVGADAPLNRIRDRTTIYANWVNSERQRVQQEEADRLHRQAQEEAKKATATATPEAFDRAAGAFNAADQAQRAAEARPSERTIVYGAEGGRMNLTGRWTFKEQESDLMALVKAVAAGTAKLEYLAFNTSRIGYAVRSEQVREIAGCKIEEIFST